MIKRTYFNEIADGDDKFTSILDLKIAFENEFGGTMASNAEHKIWEKEKEFEEPLIKSFTAEQRKLYYDLLEITGDKLSLVSEQSFVAGYKIATRTLIESLR